MRLFPVRWQRRRGDRCGRQLLPVQLRGVEKDGRRRRGGGHLCDFSRRRR